MANLLNKDPFTYHQEYTEFIRELRGYHINRGTPFIKIPQIAGRDVDLYLLYRRVIALGGWQKFAKSNYQYNPLVNDEQNWDEFLEEFNVPKGCTNGIQALKQIYIRFLNEYEKVHFLGEDPDHEIMDDEEDGPSRKKSSTPLHSVPLTYKYSQHKVSDNMRRSSGLSCQFVTFSDYEKLEMALLSGLPNEVDFVVNVCTLLSNDGKRSLRLDKSKHLLDLLLAHIGIFTSGGYSLEGIYESGWKPLSNRNFVKFWYDTVHDKEVREMISVKRDASHLRQWVGEEVLNLGRDLGVNDVEGQRVTQMAIIIRNLSFDEENMQVLASNRNVFRFLLLCIYSKYGSLRQIGLDTLGNSALQMVLESVDNPDTQLILRLVSKCLSSNDKCEVVRGLEILSKLCQVEENESVLSEHLESKAYEDICKLLTVHDIQLIIYTLEALYQLSELGESTANAIASVKHSVDILVQLVTVEAQSYGPNSLIGIKVVEFVPHQSAGGATVGPPVPPQPPPPLTMSSKVISPPGAPPSPEIETTCNWLRANIELKDGNYMSHLSLYTDYLSFCKKFSLPNPLNSSVLHTCVKAVFPNVDEKIIERKDGNKDIQFSGFSKRQTPLPFAITWQVDKPPSIHSSHGFQRASNSSQSCLTHTPTLRQRLLEPPLVHLQPDSCPPFPAGSSSTHSSQVPGVQHATMTVGANPVTPHTPKSLHVQSSQQKHCAKLLQSPGTPLRTSLASPSTSAPSTPVSRPLVVSTLPSLVSSSPAGKTVSVLQQQLRSPIAQQSLKLQDSAQSAASPNQHYPCIQHALHSEQDQNANQGSLRQQSRPNMQGKNGNISFQDNSGTAGRNSSETNLIKSLLAKKLNQNRGTQNPTGQQYQCHESPGSNATPVCNAPPSPARSDAAVSQDDFPMLETKPCIKAPLQTGSVGWTQQQPIDSPAQSDTMESQTSISQDSQYTDDQSSIETKATEQQVTGKEQVAKEIKCDGPFQEESMEVDTSLSNSQPKSLESGQLTSQEGLKEQSAGDIQCESTTQDADGSLSMPAKEPPNSVSVSVSVQNPHLEEQSTMKNTQNPQQSHLQPNPDASKSSVSSEPIVIQAAQQLEHSLVMQPASKLTTPQQKSAELVIQVGSEPSLQQQEVVIQPATDQLNNEDLVIQAQLQDQQDVMQPMTPHQQGEQFVIQGSQILIQQPPTQQQLLIRVPAQPAQPIQPAQQLVIQTTPPAAAQQTQQLVIQVPPQQQQFVIQAQQSSSSSPQAQQQFQQQIVIRDLPEDSSQEMMPENQQFEGLQQSNFSQQSPVQFGQDQIQLLGQSQLPATNSQTANTTNANTLYSQPQKSVYQSVDSSLQQNQVVIQYQPVSQSATTASLPTLPKVSPASPGEASLDSSLSPQTLTKCVFQSQGHLFPSSQNIQLENSQKSKKGRTSPVNKNTSVHTCRAMVKSTVPKQKLTQISDSTIPYTSSPCSPRALEIEVCGEVECAKDIVKEGAEARIQRVENKCLRLFDRPVEPSNVENTESSQAPGIVGNAKELPDSVTKNNLLPCADHKKLLHNHTHSIPSTNTELKDKIAEPPVAFVYSTDTVPKRNVEFVGSNTCHNLHDSSTCHLHRPLSSSKVKEEKSAVADSVIKMECPNSNTVQTKKEEQTILSHDTSAENENLGPKQTASIKCESPKPNRTVYAPVAQVNGAAPATSDASVARPVPQCTHGRAVDESSKLCSSEQLHNGLATSSPTATETKLNLNEVKKSEELSVNEKTILHKPVDRLGKVNGIINHLGSNECKPSLDTKTVVLADNQNQKERKRKASVSSLSPNSSSSNSSSTVARVPENGCVVNGLQENVNINDCKFLTDNNNIERTATNLNSGSCAKKHRQSEVTGNISLKKKSEKSNTSVVCSYVNRTCESRLVAPPPDSGDGDISCDSSSVSSVQDAFDKQHSNLNQGLPGTLLSKDNKDTALRPGQSISPKGGTGGNLDKSAKARKRIRNNTGSGDSRCSSSASTEFVCEWANCKRCFESSKSVYSHVYSAHVVTESDGICKWEGCEKLERKKWSLVTHIQDQHCSEAALRAAGQRRIQSVQMNLSGAVAHAAPPTQSQPPPPLQVSPAAASVSAPCVATPGSGASGVVGTGVAAAAAPGTANLVYPPDAAIQAIRRFSARPPFPELMPTNHVPYPVHYQRYDFKPRNPEYIFMEMQFNNNPVFQEPREGPVTKHIRLTAALILRNLSRYSTLGRRLLKKHETYLGYTAMSAVESSNALANCLWEILQKH